MSANESPNRLLRIASSALFVLGVLANAYLLSRTQEYHHLPRYLGLKTAETRSDLFSLAVILTVLVIGCFLLRKRWPALLPLRALLAVGMLTCYVAGYCVNSRLSEAQRLAAKYHTFSCLDCFENCKGQADDCKDYCNNNEKCVGER